MKFLAAIFLAFALVASTGADQLSIWYTIAANPEFSILAKFVTQANLVDALNDDSARLTVFAPTNAAFAQLNPQVATYLASPAHAAQLSSLLLSHVVKGVVPSSILTDGLTVDTLSGLPLHFFVRNGGYSGIHISANASEVTENDIAASNGLIHVVDRVILPSRSALVAPSNTIASLAAGTPNLSYLLAALKTSGLAPAFAGNGTFTVFAPVDSAFTPLIRDAFRLNSDLLVRVLKYHVLATVTPSTGLYDGLEAATLNGNSIRVSRSAFGDKSFTFINDAQVILSDSTATNGVVHLIDRVLFPPQ